MNPLDHEEHIRHSFDGYCKKVIKRKSIDIHRENKRRSSYEVSFSDLSTRELLSIAVSDRYFTGDYIFTILGESVGVGDATLAEALYTLPTDSREIVLMAYFFDMTDMEIAERLNIARRTVAYRRKSSLKDLRYFLESED